MSQFVNVVEEYIALATSFEKRNGTDNNQLQQHSSSVQYLAMLQAREMAYQ